MQNTNTSGVKSDVSQTYIESLPSTYTEEDLRRLIEPFAKRGAIESLVFKKHVTGAQTGFGFITFENQEDATECQSSLNGITIDDQIIRCGFKNSTKKLSQKNLYIEGLPESWGEGDLRAKFSVYGTITECRLFMNKKTNSKTGVGFVHFSTGDEAHKALEALNESLPEEGAERVMRVRFANEPRKRRAWGRGGFRGGRGGPRGRGGFRGGYGGYGNYAGWGGYGGYGMGGWGQPNPYYGYQANYWGGRGRGNQQFSPF